jgi:glycosyltransferase involved in cell wall biosynthesis
MKLSVIIPVYNVEEYIEKCILSLQHQDIPEADYELIITNDGSPDNSLSIIRNLKKSYSNIVLIDQENQGVSIARNNAIARATGD